MDIQQDDITLTGVLGPDRTEGNGDYHTFSGFTSSMGSNGQFEAVWTLTEPIVTDAFLLTLDGTTSNAITDQSGNLLDGEWADAESTYPSGNAQAGGDFNFRFNVSVGDVDGDDDATIFDIKPLRDSQNLDTGDIGYDIRADLNGDGVINDADVDVLRNNLGWQLPSGPIPPATASSRRGSTSADITITADRQLIEVPVAQAQQGSFDIVLETSDGSSVTGMNYQVRVRLIGPAVGTDVSLTGGGEANDNPASIGPNPPNLLNTPGFEHELPDEYYISTANLNSASMTIDSGDGLMRVEYEVQPCSLGTYEVEIVSGGTAETAVIVDAANNTLPFTVDNAPLIITIPGDLTGPNGVPDHVVGTDDLQVILSNFTQLVDSGDFTRGDIAGPGGIPDGVIGTDDLQEVLGNFTNAGLPQECAVQLIYEEDFEDSVGPEWSIPITSVTPVGQRRFLGEFGSQTVSLNLSNLPSHSEINMSFDLFIIRSWDGNNTSNGPDIWELNIAEGLTLLTTSFSVGFEPIFHEDYPQAYPDSFPGGSYIPGTGADEINSLGYVFDDFGIRDSVYRISHQFGHADASLIANFSARGLEGISNESWGIDNVRITIPGSNESAAMLVSGSRSESTSSNDADQLSRWHEWHRAARSVQASRLQDLLTRPFEESRLGVLTADEVDESVEIVASVEAEAGRIV